MRDIEEAVLLVMEEAGDEENRELLADMAANLIPLTGGIDNAVHLNELLQCMDEDRRPEPFASFLKNRIKTIYPNG